ncbi:transmembrane protein, putative (macronuclear) [Tetrahymena thermophila SB210]|uniref:Transmembrane protein, putative n=1 Tax=Tetrahymena thermophila (strain SB210) TaxID=312017 RepID=W7XJS0_TETTS|nr:transmembrane protein, putative [Tetrahymena thermophila SB210]EWS75881.1 transmembrane protein, putative [Tetrahymena thermophila SB210]|eukprot:XP_012651584.1 transmembrane protein, putative [Tetrahymena thermophila SB210]
MKNLRELEKKRSTKDILYEALSNLFLLMFLKDSERNRERVYYVGLVSIYFSQIAGFIITASQITVTDDYLKYLFELCQSVRITYLLRSLDSGILVGVILFCLCIYEVTLILFNLNLSFANIKDDVDILKTQANQIGAVQLYYEHQKWLYCLPKLDLIFSVLFCDGSSHPQRCSLSMVNPSNQGMIFYFNIVCSIILLMTTIILNLIVVLIYHNPELSSVNQLKSRYSQFKQIEPLLEIGLVLLTYLGSPIIIYSFGQMFGLFLLVEYFYHFPLMDKNISDIYGWMVIVYQTYASMLLFREYTTSIKDANFPIIFLLIISILYGILKTFWNNKIIFAMTVDPNRLGDFPQASCLYLEKLCEQFEQCLTTLSSKLILFGSLQLHKNNCRDTICPCKDTQFNELAGEERPTISGGMIIDLGKDIKIKGVDFARICDEQVVFEKWFMLFIDYQFEVLISHLVKKGQEVIVQEVCLRYWFFLIKFKKNQIKALYQNKVMNQMLKRKDSFFQTVERSLTNLIESKIKEKDKAHFYSYSQKDRQDAMNNIKFDKMVQSETEKDRIKKILGNLIVEKCIFMDEMVKGFKSLEEMRQKIINFLFLVEYFEQILKEQMNLNKQNIYFLKFSSLLKAYILFDPINCRDTEAAVEEIINRERSVDQTTTITSLSILQGNVGSIIASFKNVKENGKILKFSEKIPQIFKYNKGEFITKESVTDLIPDCIGRLHDQFLMRLISTGVAKTVRNYRTMFAKDKMGYIFRVKLFINFYFIKQDDFAFSSLVINCPSNDMYVLLNSKGYIEGMSESFAHLIQGEKVESMYFKKLNISALIPQFIEFMQEFNMKEEYSFLKFKLDVPKDMNKLIQTFILHHSNYYSSQQTSERGKENQSRSEIKKPIKNNTEWKNNVQSFLNSRVQQKLCSYEITLNIRHELFQDNGEDVLIYILEIQSYVNWDDLLQSEFSNSTGGRSKHSQKVLQSDKTKQDNLNYQITHQETMANQLIGQLNTQHSQNDNINLLNTDQYIDLKQDKEIQGQKSAQIDSCDNLDKQNPNFKSTVLQPKLQNYANLDDSNMPILDNKKLEENMLDTNAINNTLMMTTQQYEDEKELVAQLNKSKTMKYTKVEDTTKYDFSQTNQACQDQDNQETGLHLSQEQQKLESEKQKKEDDSSQGHDSKNNGKESISVFDDAKKEIGNDLIKQMGRKNELPFDQGSKSSMQSSSSSIVKHIIDNTTSKSTPPFLVILYGVFIFQFFVFITVVIVLSVTISNSFNSYTQALNRMGSSSKMLIPINQAMITSDITSLKNMDQLNPVPSVDYMTVMEEVTRSGYQQYSDNLFNFLDLQVQYQYQKIVFNMIMDVSLMSFRQKLVSRSYFTEYLKSAGTSLFNLNRNDQQNQITVFMEEKYLLVNNLNCTQSYLLVSMQSISDDLGTLQSSIIVVNTYSIVLAIVLIILSFGFIIPSYNNLKFKSERILMIVSRLKQEETTDIIFHLKAIQAKLFSDDDEYLHIDFSNFALREENELEQSQRANKKKNKQRQNYLYDRIFDNKLKFWSFIIILIFLCLLSVLFFLIIFIYLNQFESIFGTPANQYKQFIQGSMQFTTASSSHNSILLNSLLKENNIEYLTDEKLNELIELRAQSLLQSQQYFSQQFVLLQQHGSTSNFQNMIVKVSQQNICEQNILDQKYIEYCQSALQGILTQGLQPTVSTIIQKIQNEMNIDKNFNKFIQSQEYQDGIIVQQLLTNVMTYVVVQFENQNVNIKNDYLNILLLILTLGSLVYVLIFFIVIAIYLNKLKREYLVIKKAIQLVPYRRLTEDSMTLFLLKKVMDV